MRSKREQEEFFRKTISLIQKEWHREMGDPESKMSEKAMEKAHDLLMASKSGNLLTFLKGRSIQEYIGREWLEAHSDVKDYVDSVLRKKY